MIIPKRDISTGPANEPAFTLVRELVAAFRMSQPTHHERLLSEAVSIPTQMRRHHSGWYQSLWANRVGVLLSNRPVVG